jgi:hypothetical protein
MDSFAAPNAASPKRKSSDPYTQPTGVKKIKIAKGGEIKKMAPLFDPDNSPSLQPNTTPLHQEKYDARSQASIKKTKSDPFTPLADAISNSAEQHGDDFDIFIEYPTPLQIREQEAHEKAVLRAKVLTLPHPVANPKPKPAAAPVAVATPIMEATVAGPQPTAPDFSQRLSLRRMKTAAGNTLEQRRKALDGARAQIESIIQMISSDTAKKPLEKIERTLIEQIKQVDADIEKLQLFGLGFQTNNIKGIDDKVSPPSDEIVTILTCGRQLLRWHLGASMLRSGTGVTAKARRLLLLRTSRLRPKNFFRLRLFLKRDILATKRPPTTASLRQIRNL